MNKDIPIQLTEHPAFEELTRIYKEEKKDYHIFSFISGWEAAMMHMEQQRQTKEQNG